MLKGFEQIDELSTIVESLLDFIQWSEDTQKIMLNLPLLANKNYLKLLKKINKNNLFQWI
jgi:hypothetical protein